MEFILYIDFSQFLISDADASSWPQTNKQTYDQGFTRLEDFASIRTLIEGGKARTSVKAMDFKTVDHDRYDRVIQLPFKSNSKKLKIFCPADYEKNVIEVPSSNLLVTIFQALISEDDEIQETLICIEENRLETTSCIIIKCDPELNPTYPLLELSKPL